MTLLRDLCGGSSLIYSYLRILRIEDCVGLNTLECSYLGVVVTLMFSIDIVSSDVLKRIWLEDLTKYPNRSPSWAKFVGIN